MNVKEKAIEIMSMYRPIINNSMSKECAIIHVNGVIEELESIFKGKGQSSGIVFWKEVLTELNQM